MDATTYFPALPQGWQRSQLEALLVEIAPAINLGKRLSVLLYMMANTRPSDWTARDREPVYFALQNDTALAVGKTTRAIRTDERVLEALGLIDVRTKANGARTSIGRCGIVFSRLIDMVPDLIALRDRLRAERSRTHELVHRRSNYLRHIKKALEAISVRSPQRAAIVQAFDQWPDGRELRRLPLATLEQHVEDARSLCIWADEVLQNNVDSSAEADQNFRLLIQEDTKDTLNVSCNEDDHERTSGKPEDFISFSNAPDGASGREEKDAGGSAADKAQMALDLARPEQLYRLAGEEMRAQIEKHAAGRAITPTVVIDAAHDRLSALGINYSAWHDAAGTMSAYLAAVWVLIIDANRDHPATPVINPGGALRSITRKHRQKQLNLVGSLIGLKRRRGIGVPQ